MTSRPKGPGVRPKSGSAATNASTSSGVPSSRRSHRGQLTSSASRDKLANLKAEIEREQEESVSTAMLSMSIEEQTHRERSLAKDRSSTRDQILTAEKKLEAIKVKKEQISNLLKRLKGAQCVDLCFMVDCTGSMDRYIAEVKGKIQDLVEDIRRKFTSLKLFISFVGYRDHSDGANRITFLDFSQSVPIFKEFVENVRVGGGGDEPEDVFGGIEQVCNLTWSRPTRILFHVGDAPCHGRRFHNDAYDEFPDGDPRGLKIEDLLRKVKQLGLIYYFARLNNTTDKMIAEFAAVMGGPDQIDTFELKDASDLMPAVSEAISESILATEAATLATERYNPTTIIHKGVTPKGVKSLKPFHIDPRIPNWDTIDTEEVLMLRNILPRNLTELQQPLKVESRKRRVKICPNPFEEGAQRIAYYGKECSFEPVKSVVFKEYKLLGEGLNTLERYKEEMEIQSIAAFLAQTFKSIAPTGCKEVVFTKVFTVSFNERSKRFCCSQEKLMDGSYVKYNSNCGFVNKMEYTATLNAFSHWTYHYTDGYLMVVDLQGVKIEKDGKVTFLLTDPAIHCKDLLRFGSCNLGKMGMSRFFRTHACNSICRSLRLPINKHQPGKVTDGIVSAATFTY